MIFKGNRHCSEHEDCLLYRFTGDNDRCWWLSFCAVRLRLRGSAECNATSTITRIILPLLLFLWVSFLLSPSGPFLLSPAGSRRFGPPGLACRVAPGRVRPSRKSWWHLCLPYSFPGILGSPAVYLIVGESQDRMLDSYPFWLKPFIGNLQYPCEQKSFHWIRLGRLALPRGSPEVPPKSLSDFRGSGATVTIHGQR